MQPAFFQHNRAKLLEHIGGGLVVLSAYGAMQHANDSAAPFQQEANFWYLTGIEEPDWWLVIDSMRERSWLVSPSLSESQQIFDGGISSEAARACSGVDEVISRDQADDLLRQLTKKHSLVHTLRADPHAKHYSFTLNPGPVEMQRRLERLFDNVHDCRLEIAQLRARKQPVEITQIEKAISLTVEGFERVRASLQTARHEYELEAEFTYLFRRNGSDHAYAPIVAASTNACTLHYGRNSDRLKKKSLVLLDIGARVGGYAADITRTYAVGAPTKRQRAVHAAVEHAHQQIIELLAPTLSVEEYQQKVDTVMRSALLDLGLISSDADEAGYRRYFPHAISHGLGIDVHDSLGKPKLLQPGMVLTVEPGIYIPEENIGVRIEDDILITERGHRNLSKGLSTAY